MKSLYLLARSHFTRSRMYRGSSDQAFGLLVLPLSFSWVMRSHSIRDLI
ncbi:MULTISPECIES: hypothetical protein [Pseudanabaena]|nr:MULTISPECIES: hypothetical protein [Pseudanabaena]MEA5490261.1 hypothetical protein [Pseudanabaena sp. CCNP1317]WGS71161.1 hypothetical protein OA858_15715 [Pseudanabaena galeata CCNP1313]